MRKSTFLWLALAAFCGAVLFHTSQKVTDGRTRLAELKLQSRKEEETIRVLQAEWSYLNQPDRLEKLARQHLALGPMTARQFARIEDIPDTAAITPPADTKPAEEKPGPAAAKKPAMAPVAAASPAKIKIAPPASSLAATRIAPLAQKKAPVPVAQAPVPMAKAAPAAKAATAPPQRRDFNDLMRSLGAQ